MVSLAALIQEWIDGSPKTRSAKSLADKAGISEKTVRRSLSGEIPKPKNGTAYSMVNVIFKGDTKKTFNYMVEYADGDFDAVKALMKVSDAKLIEPDQLPEGLFSNQWGTLTFMFLANRKGIRKEALLSQIGSRANEFLNLLQEKGLLEETSNGTIKLKEHDVGLFDPTIILALVDQTVNQYDKRWFGTENGQIGNIVRSVSDEGRKVAKDILMDALQKLGELGDKYPGSNLISVATCMSTLTQNSGDDL